MSIRMSREEIEAKRREIVERGAVEAPGEVVVVGELPAQAIEQAMPEVAAEPEERGTPEDGASDGSDEPLWRRMFKGRIEGAKAGRHQSGPAPYGYRRTVDRRLVVDAVEAPVVVMMFREYLRLRSMKRLITHLAELGIRTRRGRVWSRAGISWILRNDTYVGRVHFGPVHARGNHEPIVAAIVFNKVGKLIEANNKHKSPAAPCPHGVAGSCRDCKNARARALRSERREQRARWRAGNGWRPGCTSSRRRLASPRSPRRCGAGGARSARRRRSPATP